MKNLWTNLFLWSGLMIFTLSTLDAQINQGGTPLGLQPQFKTQLNTPQVAMMQEVDIQKLIEEDKVMDTIRDIPFRFGENLYVGLNPDNSGTWDYLDNGSRVWQLSVMSKGAVSINLAFNQYHLPPGARIFVYTPDGEHVIGAFTHQNNQEDGYFATTLLPGDEVIIEYFEPADVAFKGEINLWQVTHGYRGPGEYFAKGFGDAGACNLNVACPESAGWEDQIRSSAMLVTGGNGFCSGSLINNAENDGTPYFLSANHCYSNPSTVVFWFNWQSETCANPPSIPPHDAMSGATDKARHATSDFWLMELNQPIPEDYNVYFSGWNRSLAATLDGVVVGIHHPRGDIKKFSWADGGVQAANYLGAPGSGTSHWRVGPWSGSTTTEPGSSGSPIYDPQGRIIGQLHGGYAACGNLEPDWYGRIGISWTGGGTDATRLSTWLDPNNTGVEAIFGFDPILDAAEPEAPAAIADLNIVPGNEGALLATLSWTNPSLTFEGETLTQLDTIKIFRAGELIHTILDPVIGAELQYTDNDISGAGNYTYTLRAYNAFGSSPPANNTLYIGPDVPAAVSNIELIDLDNEGFLTWDAPQEGLNGGYFLPSSITEFHITRNPDGAEFTIDAPQTEFLDQTLPGIGFYSYTIVAVNDVGEGGSATSDEVLLAAEGAVFMFSGTVTTCEGTFFDSGGPDSDYQNNENLTLTIFPETEGAKINMQFNSFNTESNYDYLYVYDGDEAIESYLVGQFSGVGVPEILQDITSTHVSGALTFRFTSDFSVTRPGWQADISCFIPSDDDLSASAITGNTTPSVGIESVYSITVNNLGFVEQDTYLVRLITDGDEVLATVPGELIQPGEQLTFPVAWTPTLSHEGAMTLYGEVILEGDANPGNNITSPLHINVLPEGIQAITIGTGNELPDFRIPFDFYWRNSLAQTIYYEEEILTGEGLITGITFYSNFATNLPGKEIRIYMQNTDLDEMTAGFVPVSEEDLVFQGTVDFPSGENTIFIPLDVGFSYAGDNLLLTTNRMYEQTYFTQNEKFYITSTPSHPNRTIQFNSDGVTIDPENPPTTGSMAYRDAHANTTLYFDSGFEPEVHMVTFNVDMSNVPYLIFDGDTDNLYITGSMTGWADPGSDPENQLMQPSAEYENIYSITLQMQTGIHNYKYFINAGWDNGEWDGSPDRTLEVTADMTVNDEFAVLEPGDQPWQYAWIQFIHNVADAEAMDITLNGKSFIADLSFRHATEYLPIPSGHDFLLEIIGMNEKSREILHAQNVNFAQDETGVAILSGLTTEEGYNPYIPLSMAFHEGRMEATVTDNTDLLVYHGSTDAPEVSVRLEEQNEPLFTFDYSDFSGYYELPAADYLLYLQPNEGQEVIYLVPLETLNLQGEALVVVASGFYQPQNNQDGPSFGLWVALAQGGPMAELTILTNIDANFTQTGDIQLYPNPARDYVQISSEKFITELHVIDMNGKVKFHAKPSEKEYILNTENLPAGVFIIRVTYESGFSVHKLINKP